jgi:hypothetical protein
MVVTDTNIATTLDRVLCRKSYLEVSGNIGEKEDDEYFGGRKEGGFGIRLTYLYIYLNLIYIKEELKSVEARPSPHLL